MDSLAEFQRRLIVGSASSGLSSDAIRSLSRLAQQLNETNEPLEKLLDDIQAENEVRSAKIQQMKSSLAEGSFLD